MHPLLPSLWRASDFRRLWAGHTISLLGSQVTFLALPLVAILSLHATPIQMGILGAIGGIPTVLFGLLVGVWVDRRHRRPILIATDLGRAVVVLCIPVAVLAGMLHMALLLLATFLIGILTLVFEVAAQAFLPTLILHEQLLDANSKLEISRSAAEIAGPGMAGVLVQLLSAPLALLADALSFVVSALLLAGIRVSEPPLSHDAGSRVRAEIEEGARWVIHHPVLRPLTGATGILAFFNSLLEAVYLLYLTHTLALTPATLGIIFTLGGVGFLLGALAAERVARRVGVGRTLILALALVGLADLVAPLIGGSLRVVAPALVGAECCFGLGLVVFNITTASLRQGSTPDRLQGRMNATVRLFVQGLTPLGALAGGVLGQSIGLRPTLLMAVGGELLAALWLLCSSVRSLGAPA